MELKSLVESLVPKTPPLALASATGPSGTRPATSRRSHRNFWFSSNDPDEVEVTRRRTGDGSPRERAGAPSRRQDQPSDTGRTGGGGLGGGGGIGGLGGGGGSQLPIGDIIALLLKLPPRC